AGTLQASTVLGSPTVTLSSGTTEGFFIGMPVSGTGLTRTLTASTTKDSTSVTVSGGSVSDFSVGMLVTGNGIAPGTVITSINGPTLQLSSAATATATGVSV